jgi:hypothetical protein
MGMEVQEAVDAFYFKHGPCCAGCDLWRHLSSSVGECTESAPMSGAERMGLLGITNCSMAIGAGHALTRRDHHCGQFRDEFDWPSLPLSYVKRVGGPIRTHPLSTTDDAQGAE